MKTLKISFLQSTPDFGREGMLQLLKSRYHVVEDDSDFDYLVATPWFYVNREAFYDFLERAPGHITVMYGCHEAIAPDFMLFDYYIGLDTVPGSDRTVKLPYLRHHLQEVHGGKEGLDAHALLASKTGFCNFIYANRKSHPNRDAMFYKLSAFRFVNSLGPHLNNTPGDGHRAEDWYASSIRMKKPYKFSIAFENAWYPGYTSEKIVTSMLAGTIPIYWGNPDISREFNSASFINCHDFPTLDDAAAYVKKVDEDDNLWCEIMSRPWKTPEQEARFLEETERETAKLYKIFDQSPEALDFQAFAQCHRDRPFQQAINTGNFTLEITVKFIKIDLLRQIDRKIAKIRKCKPFHHFPSSRYDDTFFCSLFSL